MTITGKPDSAKALATGTPASDAGATSSATNAQASGPVTAAVGGKQATCPKTTPAGKAQILDRTARITAHTYIAPGLWRLALAVEDIPGLMRPGQFVHLQLGTRSEFILRRPISVHAVLDDGDYDGDGGPVGLVLTYQVVGKGTDFLTTFREGDALKVLGPIGRGWQPPPAARRVLLVGGGVGWAPLAMLAGRLLRNGVEVHTLIGAQDAATLLALTEATGCTLPGFCSLKTLAGAASAGSVISEAAWGAGSACSSGTTKGMDSMSSIPAGKTPGSTKTGKTQGPANTEGTACAGDADACASRTVALHEHWATDDGSRGHHGFNTELLPELFGAYEFDYLATCGPEPMQRKAVEVAADAEVPIEVSLERRMACGIGACLSCVADTTEGRKRVCVDGPVFNGRDVSW